MLHCIVIGNPVLHSKSPQLHQAFAQQTNIALHYHRQFCPNDQASFQAVVEAFFHGGGTGANVTVPFKEMAFDLCQKNGQLSEYAQKAKAVNTLAIKDGQLYGDNTDGRGLVNHLLQMNWQLKDQEILILGAGGATRGILLPLMLQGVRHIHLANRTLQKADDLLTDFQNDRSQSTTFSTSKLENIPKQHYDMIINATSIGLSDDILPFRQDLQTDFAYDLMYGKPSKFLQFFAKAKTADGLGMLIHQGALSFQLWTGKTINLTDFKFES